MIKQERDCVILRKYLLFLQGIYYAAAGIWPVLHIDSFLWVSCPKTDLWLVKTVGLLLFCEGICFIADGLTNRLSASVCLLAFLNILCLAGIDIYYSLSGVICKIYLADATLQLSAGVLWMFVFFRGQQARRVS